MKKNIIRILVIALLLVLLFCNCCFADVISPYGPSTNRNTSVVDPTPSRITNVMKYVRMLWIVAIVLLLPILIVAISTKKPKQDINAEMGSTTNETQKDPTDEEK